MGYLDKAGTLAKNIFEDVALTSSVILTPVSVSLSNIEGDQIFTDGTPTAISCYIVRTDKKFMFEKYGEIESGDAIMLVTAAQTVEKDYKVTWNNNTYRVEDVLKRDQPGTGITVYKRCRLILISSEESDA